MPSFDVVSTVNMHEVNNAVDQANREVSTRFDFKGSQADYQLHDSTLQLTAESEFQLQQMLDILITKLTKRAVDVASLSINEASLMGKLAKQTVAIKQGIETPLAKKIVKTIKDSKLKVQASIQGDQVRVTGKKRDDLQQVMDTLRQCQFDLPLQFENLRD